MFKSSILTQGHGFSMRRRILWLCLPSYMCPLAGGITALNVEWFASVAESTELRLWHKNCMPTDAQTCLGTCTGWWLEQNLTHPLTLMFWCQLTSHSICTIGSSSLTFFVFSHTLTNYLCYSSTILSTTKLKIKGHLLSKFCSRLFRLGFYCHFYVLH